jgi:hypothetical protein
MWLSERKNTGIGFEQSARLACEALWLIDVRGNEKHFHVNFPIWARRPWDAFKKAHGVEEAGFQVWIRWYEFRLAGGRFGLISHLRASTAQELDIKVGKQPNSFWDRAAAIVNADIMRGLAGVPSLPHYNLIMTGTSGEWESGAAKVFRSRFLEYTEESIVEQYRKLTSSVVGRLVTLPTLFAYETAVNEPARVGRLKDIKIGDRTIDIWFEFDSSIPAISPNHFSQIRERLGINNAEQHRTHWAIKSVDLYSELLAAGIHSQIDKKFGVTPPEPSSGIGPQYHPRDGKLSEISNPPVQGEAAQQANLHKLLLREAATLAKNLERSANRFPELSNAASEYFKLLNTEITNADVTAIWAVGGSIASFARSYREQSIAKTLAEPLEPQLDALLQSVVRQHGAFILGFEEGRDLVQRADEFAVDTTRLRELEGLGSDLLNEFTDNSNLVDDRTREIHRPVRDSATEFGWATSRVGFSAYLIVRNGVRAIIKFTLGNDPNIGAILGVLAGGSALAGDSEALFIRAALPVLQHHGVQILAFFNHSPEMRAYVEWALRILEEDRKDRR